MTRLLSGSKIPSVFCAVLVLLFLAYLGWQAVGLNALATSAPQALPHSQPIPANPIATEQLATLFGATASRANQAHVTQLNLQLHGSFVHAEAEKSSALISRLGEKPKRLNVGQALDDNTQLHQIHRDHVELMHNGKIELLNFPAADRIATVNRGDPGEFNGTEIPTDELLAEQATALREQMEAASQLAAHTDNLHLEND